MHHVVVERWSRGRSYLHARDPRAKLAACIGFLVIVATTPQIDLLAYGAYFTILLAGILAARLPVSGMLARGAMVLPFSLVFGLVSWVSGDPGRALSLVIRSYLSALTALLLAGSTPLPQLLYALRWFRIPAILVQITQFLYRYLFVLVEQAQHMRLAAASRSGQPAGRAARKRTFQAAAGALSVLFARSYQRAEGIHRAMLARGYSGVLHGAALKAGAGDLLFAGAAILLPLSLRLVRWI